MKKSILILKDNFQEKINEEIWDSSRINQKSWSISNDLSKNTDQTSLKITVDKDAREVTDKESIDRAELSEKEEVMISPGEEVWYGLRFYLPSDFAILNNRLVFAQWKQYAPHLGSPFLSARYINGKLSFKITAENLVKKYEKSIDLRGNWNSIIVNYRLNSNQTGFAKAWLNNELILDYSGPLDYHPTPNKLFFKMGLYRDTIEEKQTIYFDRFRRGPNKQSVMF